MKAPNWKRLAVAIITLSVLLAAPIVAVAAPAKGNHCGAKGTYGYTAFGNTFDGNLLGIARRDRVHERDDHTRWQGELGCPGSRSRQWSGVEPRRRVRRHLHSQFRLHLRCHDHWVSGTNFCWRDRGQRQTDPSDVNDSRGTGLLRIYGQSESGVRPPLISGHTQTWHGSKRPVAPAFSLAGCPTLRLLKGGIPPSLSRLGVA